MTGALLEQTLKAVMGKMAGLRRAIMFSGGFDSILMACLAQEAGAKLLALTVQFEDFNPLTVAGSIEAAGKIGIAHQILHVKAVEFLSAFDVLTGITDGPVLDLDLALVFAALKKYEPKIAGDIIISGMGSDQWFGNEALEARPDELAVRLDKARSDEMIHQRVAEIHGCKFIFPFLSKEMLAIAQNLPVDLKKNKKLLRSLPIAQTIPHSGIRSEIQVPPLMRQILIKTYGDRALPYLVKPINLNRH